MDNFKLTKLSELVTRVKVGFVGSINEYYCEKENGVPLIRTTDINELGINYSSLKYVTKEFHTKNKKSQIKKGDLIIARHGDNGKANVFKEEFEAQVLNAVIIQPDQNKLESNLLKYFFDSPFIKKQILGVVKGSVQGVINTAHISDVLIPINNKINYNGLSKFINDLDSKIELNNRINTELEAMAKTIYDYWFVQFDFPNAKGKPYKTSGGKMVWNEELRREIPVGWKVGSLLSLGEIIGGSTPPREIQEYFTNKGTAWITPKDLSLNTGNKFITRGELDVSDEGIKAASLKIMPKGTILLSSRAPIGYLAISREDVTTNQGFKSFVPNKGFPTEYVYYTVKNMIPTIENNAVGSTFKEVSASTLKSIKICLPEKGVIEKYKCIVDSIFKRQNLLELENKELAELRDWLLPMLMNGQVKVRDFAN